jgi:hypothetical protein
MMNLLKCYSCKEEINEKRTTLEEFSQDKHIFVCKKCTDESYIYSKTYCIDELLIKPQELEKLKSVYNVNYTENMYMSNDIQSLIMKKYKTYSEKTQYRYKKSQQKILERRTELISALKDNKLDLKDHGDCFMYITYGNVPIGKVIENELKVSNEISNRRIDVINELNKHDIDYNEKCKYTYDYIHNITHKSLDDTIRLILLNRSHDNNIANDLCNNDMILNFD